MHGYTVLFEHNDKGTSWSAYVPDLPGCIAAADTLDECRTLIHEAVAFHLQSMREDGDFIPAPTILAEVLAA